MKSLFFQDYNIRFSLSCKENQNWLYRSKYTTFTMTLNKRPRRTFLESIIKRVSMLFFFMTCLTFSCWEGLHTLLTSVPRLCRGFKLLYLSTFFLLVLNSLVLESSSFETLLTMISSFVLEIDYLTISEKHLFWLSIFGVPQVGITPGGVKVLEMEVQEYDFYSLYRKVQRSSISLLHQWNFTWVS